jgi:hypothetical protein
MEGAPDPTKITPTKRKAAGGSLTPEQGQRGRSTSDEAAAAAAAVAGDGGVMDEGGGSAEGSVEEKVVCINCHDVAAGLALLSYAQQSSVFDSATDQPDVHLNSCGHAMCKPCHSAFMVARVQQIRQMARYQSPVEMLRQDAGGNLVLDDFFCPLCNTLCNCAVPVFEGAYRIGIDGIVAGSEMPDAGVNVEASYAWLQHEIATQDASASREIQPSEKARTGSNDAVRSDAFGGGGRGGGGAASAGGGATMDVESDPDAVEAETEAETIAFSLRASHDRIVAMSTPPRHFIGYMKPVQTPAGDALNISDNYLATVIATIGERCGGSGSMLPFGSAALLTALITANRFARATDAYGPTAYRKIVDVAVAAFGPGDVETASAAQDASSSHENPPKQILPVMRDPFHLFLHIAMAFPADPKANLGIAKAAARLCVVLTVVQTLSKQAADLSPGTSGNAAVDGPAGSDVAAVCTLNSAVCTHLGKGAPSAASDVAGCAAAIVSAKSLLWRVVIFLQAHSSNEATRRRQLAPDLVALLGEVGATSLNQLLAGFATSPLLARWVGKWPSGTDGAAGGVQLRQNIGSLSKIRPFVPLPREFTELLYEACQQVCPGTGKPMEKPVLCLTCGVYFCSGTVCCEQSIVVVAGQPTRKFNACSMHTLTCGAGKGAFIAVKSCHLVLLNHERGSRRPAPYADSHGEGDAGLKRGRPLFLNAAMLDNVKAMFRGNTIPGTVASDLANNRRTWRGNYYHPDFQGVHVCEVAGRQ